jgi:hypothetical protein
MRHRLGAVNIFFLAGRTMSPNEKALKSFTTWLVKQPEDTAEEGSPRTQKKKKKV